MGVHRRCAATCLVMPRPQPPTHAFNPTLLTAEPWQQHRHLEALYERRGASSPASVRPHRTFTGLSVLITRLGIAGKASHRSHRCITPACRHHRLFRTAAVMPALCSGCLLQCGARCCCSPAWRSAFNRGCVLGAAVWCDRGSAAVHLRGWGRRCGGRCDAGQAVRERPVFTQGAAIWAAMCYWDPHSSQLHSSSSDACAPNHPPTHFPLPARDEAKLRQALALVSSHNGKPLRIDLQ